MYEDNELIQLSALQHFLFCPRQCALIHLEQIWEDNIYTIEGQLLHKRAHSGKIERRPEKHTEYGMPIRSLTLGLSGKTDAVEYGIDGHIHVVEYKRGKPKKGREDEVQLCAQALCIEEMKKVKISEGYLYYGKVKRRRTVLFDDELRKLTITTAKRLHAFIKEEKTPPAKYNETKCPRCSLLSLCLPKILSKTKTVQKYYDKLFFKDEDCTS